MTSGKTSKAVRGARAAKSSVVVKKPKPWGTVAAVVVVLLFAGGVFGFIYNKYTDKKAVEEKLAAWTPSETNQDPSTKIAGVVKQDYEPGKHVSAAQRVAYDKLPPYGGAHDNAWAACTGEVYEKPVRTENLVHSIEHGAIWIAYNPEQVTGADLDTLKGKVEGQPFMVMAPYPGLDKPISLQAWGRQLKLDSASDERIDQFVKSLRSNRFTTPEANGSCDALGPGAFDPDNPPPFIAEKPGPDAVPVDGGTKDQQEGNMSQPGQPQPTQPGQPGPLTPTSAPSGG